MIAPQVQRRTFDYDVGVLDWRQTKCAPARAQGCQRIQQDQYAGSVGARSTHMFGAGALPTPGAGCVFLTSQDTWI